MKKTILLGLAFLLSAGAVSAAPEGQAISYAGNKSRFLSPKLATDRTITYCTYLGRSGTRTTDETDFEKNILLALKLWRAYPAYLIRQQGREKEFAPVLKALERPARLTRLAACSFEAFDKKYQYLLDPQPLENFNGQEADISFFFEDSYFSKAYGENTNASYFSIKPVPHVLIGSHVTQNHAKSTTWPNNPVAHAEKFNMLRERILQTPLSNPVQMKQLIEELMELLTEFGSSQRSLFYTLLHETGHAMGLADQHKWINSDKIRRTIDLRDSVMDYQHTFLTCDDADGIVTLFDDALGIRRKFKSLCNDGISFIDGAEDFTGDKKTSTRRREIESHYIYHEDTRTTGVYEWEEVLFVDLSEDSAKYIDEHFDRSLLKEEWGGYQRSKGTLKLYDLQDTAKGSYPIGEYYIRLTIGPGPLYKQTLLKHYDNQGNLLDYTLEIYDTHTDTVTETRYVKVK